MPLTANVLWYLKAIKAEGKDRHLPATCQYSFCYGSFPEMFELCAVAVCLCTAFLLQTEQTKIFVMAGISHLQQRDSHLRAHSDQETLTRLRQLLTTEPEAADLNERFVYHCFVARQIYLI